MKKVVIVYDNLLHKPKLHTLTSFKDNNYKYEDIFITKSNCIYDVFIEFKPDIYIIDVSFNDFKILEEIKNLFQTKHSKNCGFIIISSSCNFEIFCLNLKYQIEYFQKMLQLMF